MTKTYEQKALEDKIRDHINYNIRELGMSMWQEIDSVDVEVLAEDIIAWADAREKRHGRKNDPQIKFDNTYRIP